ncbi:carbohydrate ABC transporter permease [Actinoallomurus rhizosphaericola]|uniref:carbohydrate ABC transporter permease n=1 Tax=Actinoallomurus rhizosphaericola TaxID=2952536 RepID=UPI002091FACA|nr:carbohydrate ABC transporter permease [Actinoallomurus rhizosphaericola]MCO5995639.1 carbohydrate ABC transporter permease [Actinoallomurus rhizosphaericola]
MPTETRRPTVAVPAGTAAGSAARGARSPGRPHRRRPPNPLRALVLTAFLLFFVLPVLWLLLAATKTDDQLVHGDPLSFGSWSALRHNWDALTSYQGDAIFRWLRNSALYSFLALAITLCVTIPAGYALAMTEFRGRRTLLAATLVVMLMPNATLVVPLFLEINAVHLVGSMWSVILPYSFYPFGVYLTYIYFSTAMPKELLAAAKLDGCSEFGAFRRIALPLAAPVVALVGFFSFVANWTNYFLPYVLLPDSDQFPVQVGLGTLLNNVPQFNPTVGSLEVQRPELALATLLAITPVLLVFLFSQRFLVAGMLAGATKE